MKLALAVAAATFVVLAGRPAATQTPDAVPELSFGGATQDYVVTASQCQQMSATPRWVEGNYQFFGFDPASGGTVTCPVTLPHGARVTGIECIVRDSSAGEITVSLLRWSFDLAANLPVTGSPVLSLNSTGITGYQVLSTPVAPPVTVRRRSGDERSVYSLLVTIPADVPGNAAFRECAILWNRQVAAPPATATFSDVPVGHAQRPFVEALVAAGITAGCSPTTYCPDSPLTRGQMAVFLAVALGLHFPN